MADNPRNARYHANLAGDYAHEAATAKQNVAQESDVAFNNRVAMLRVKSQMHATAAQALALVALAEMYEADR